MTYGLYLHIPFCRGRCRYCDFFTTVTTDGGVPDAYVDALLRDFYRHAPKGPDGAPLPPSTVYFGGGTPGLLSPAQLSAILAAVRPRPGAEVTLEANPESAGERELDGWLHAGVNRLSLGVQTARDDSLARLGRRHTAAMAQKALLAARRAGFQNISGDLMLALPGYTLAELEDTLALLADGGVQHLSAYLLKIEPGTPFGQNPPAGLPTPDQQADFYLTAIQRLENLGYHRYEISNFARPGFQGRHNLLYWDAGHYLGLGPAAHSSLCGRRFSFAPSLPRFLEDTLPPQDEGPLTAGDYIMLRLRLEDGLDENALQTRFGTALSPRQRTLLAQLAAAGLARPLANGWALTSQGLLVQNEILARLLD